MSTTPENVREKKPINLKDLIEAEVHFGHQTSRWCPKMKIYIWGKGKIHFIDVSKTAHQLEKAADFLFNIAANSKQILFVGTKKAAQNSILTTATKLNYPFVTHRWIGGSLTNFSQVKKSITKLLHFQDVLKKSEQFSYTKKELNRLQKAVKRLQDNIGGIINLRLPIGALVVVDVKKEQAAIKEAKTMGIPIVGIVDTNSDPSLIDYVIPSNDDSVKSINLILNYLADSIETGKAQAIAQRESDMAARQQEGASEALSGEVSTLAAGELESDEDNIAREQARARKLRESIKAKKGDVRRGPQGRSRKPSAR